MFHMPLDAHTWYNNLQVDYTARDFYDHVVPIRNALTMEIDRIYQKRLDLEQQIAEVAAHKLAELRTCDQYERELHKVVLLQQESATERHQNRLQLQVLATSREILEAKDLQDSRDAEARDEHYQGCMKTWQYHWDKHNAAEKIRSNLELQLLETHAKLSGCKAKKTVLTKYMSDALDVAIE